MAWKDNKKVLIECKRFAINRSVGRRDIQILHSAIVDAKAEEGCYVTTGAYAHTAVKYARDNKIKIYDRHAIPWLVMQAYGPSHDYSKAEVMYYECRATIFLPVSCTTPSGNCENGHEVFMNITLADLGVNHIHEPSTPTCPKCGLVMPKIEKYGRRPFWGCPDYPRCRGTALFGSTK